MFFGEVPLTGPAAAKGVYQCQALIELRVGSRRCGGRRIKWLQRRAAGLSLGIGPDGNRIEVGLDEFRERKRGVGCRHAPRHAAADDWKRIPQPVEYELPDRVADRLPAAAEQAGRRGPGKGTVNRGQAEGERVGELLDRKPGAQGELQGHDNVLGVEMRLHATSILSRFWKMEVS